MFKKDDLINYIRGTFIIVLVLLLILVSFYGIASEGSPKAKLIFFSVYGAVSGVALIAYWIYAFVLERRKVKGKGLIEKEEPKKESKKKDDK